MTKNEGAILEAKRILEKANNHFNEGNAETALECVQYSNDLALKNELLEELAQGLKLRATIFQSRSNYAEAMKSALEARELFANNGNIQGESDCLNILGGVYNYLGDLKNRLQCNLSSLELRKKLNNDNAVLSSLNNIGDTYLSLRDFDNALVYFEQCLTFENVSDTILAIVKCNIAEVYYLQENYEHARSFNTEGLNHAIASNYYQIIVAAHTLDGQMEMQESEFQLALKSFEMAMEVIREHESKEQEIEIYKLMSDCYFSMGEFESAYFHLKEHLSLSHKVSEQNNSQKMKKIEFDFQFKSITKEAKEIKEKNQLLTEAFNQIEEQSKEIQQKNKAITDSIHYAKRIQYAILPDSEKVDNCLPNAFIYYHPKDIVSGDFYWVEQVGDQVLFAVVDCTGHGVPGAFVSIIANNALNKIIVENKVTTPGKILNEMNSSITTFFEKSDKKIRDGVDMGICSWNANTRELQFAGAFNSLFLFEGNELIEVKGNRESIGASIYHHEKEFKNYSFNVGQGTKVYLSSDGFPDQFGGPKGKKLKWKGLRLLLESIGNQSIKEQDVAVRNYFKEWIGDLEQLDDICIMGVEL